MTGGDDGDPLRKLEQSGHVECLLEALGKDLPDSVHVFNRISTHLRWRRQGLGGDVQVDFYRGADEGDATSGPTTAVSIMRVEGMAPRVAVHTTDPSCDALHRVLAASKHIPWSEPFLFESVHERCTPAVLAEARARGQVAPLVCPTDKMLLPKDEGLRLQVGDPGPGLRLRALEPHHAKAVNDKWSYANPGSERMLAKTIERNSGLSWGVFTEDDPEGDPVSFILGGAWTGGLTVLFTTEPFRRRGLAELVTRAACRALAARHGLDAHCNVDVPNAASRATLAK
ncbi:uncharacterized protein LOC113210634 isoform X2 [Frankliniella occidentalis]|nr:uncharacterized protein LOC113210634 isoform X2 [Frankliniella occidentalis]XP_052124587.1 uncharacterized protein LOC113210634 isoform X2 [Frankliniella occidentalis]